MPSDIEVVIEDAGVRARLTLSAQALELIADALEIARPHLDPDQDDLVTQVHRQTLQAKYAVEAETAL